MKHNKFNIIKQEIFDSKILHSKKVVQTEISLKKRNLGKLKLKQPFTLYNKNSKNTSFKPLQEMLHEKNHSEYLVTSWNQTQTSFINKQQPFKLMISNNVRIRTSTNTPSLISLIEASVEREICKTQGTKSSGQGIKNNFRTALTGLSNKKHPLKKPKIKPRQEIKLIDGDIIGAPIKEEDEGMKGSKFCQSYLKNYCKRLNRETINLHGTNHLFYCINTASTRANTFNNTNFGNSQTQTDTEMMPEVPDYCAYLKTNNLQGKRESWRFNRSLDHQNDNVSDKNNWAKYFTNQFIWNALKEKAYKEYKEYSK